jgi:dihydrodipicolinate synthase/N-acetylneuraminate lyase
MALANILASDLILMEHLFHSGQLQKAADLQSALIEINQAVTKTYGIPGTSERV